MSKESKLARAVAASSFIGQAATEELEKALDKIRNAAAPDYQRALEDAVKVIEAQQRDEARKAAFMPLGGAALDGAAIAQGLQRMPGETDQDLRNRLLGPPRGPIGATGASGALLIPANPVLPAAKSDPMDEWVELAEKLAEKHGLPRLTGEPGIRDPEHRCEQFDPSPRKPFTLGTCDGDGHYLCRQECRLFRKGLSEAEDEEYRETRTIGDARRLGGREAEASCGVGHLPVFPPGRRHG